MQASPPPDAPFHIPSLDGIRALSFLVVFTAHAGLQHYVPGGFGVTVFFFLSGFLITTLLRLERARHGTISFRRFYLRRALRILPPLYLVLGLAVAAAATGWLPGGLDARAVLAQALHLANYWIVVHGYAGQPSGTGVYWSLAVEEHFYLVFPVVFLLLARGLSTRGRQAAWLGAACLVVLAWRCALVYVLRSSPDRTYVASDTRIDSILFGCMLATYGNPALGEPSRLPDWVWKRALLPASLLLLAATFVWRDPGFRETFRYSLQGVALVAPFVVAIRAPRWGLFRALDWAPLRWLGVLSYGLYLVHHVVLDALGPWLGQGPLRAGLSLVASVVLAWGLHVGVERPCAKLRRRLLDSPPRAVGAAQPLAGVGALAEVRLP